MCSKMNELTLKAWRTNKNLSQVEVAEILGVSVSTIKNWENGITFPKPQYIDKLCELYGTSYDRIKFIPNT